MRQCFQNFVIICTLYPIGVPARYIRKKLSCSTKIIVLNSNTSCKKKSGLKMDGFVMVHIQIGLLASDLIINDKY